MPDTFELSLIVIVLGNLLLGRSFGLGEHKDGV